MTTQILVKKLSKEVLFLQKDMERIKKILFSTTRDIEGEYNPAFIKKMLTRMSSSKKSLYLFTNQKEFLHHVRSTK